jgi:hypothetical protein
LLLPLRKSKYSPENSILKHFQFILIAMYIVTQDENQFPVKEFSVKILNFVTSIQISISVTFLASGPQLCVVRVSFNFWNKFTTHDLYLASLFQQD